MKIAFMSRTSNNLSQITLPISFTSDLSYSVLCNIYTPADNTVMSVQVHIKSKTTSVVIFPGSTSGYRQIIAVGF